MLDNHKLPRFVAPTCAIYPLFLHDVLHDCEYMIEICHSKIYYNTCHKFSTISVMPDVSLKKKLYIYIYIF